VPYYILKPYLQYLINDFATNQISIEEVEEGLAHINRVVNYHIMIDPDGKFAEVRASIQNLVMDPGVFQLLPCRILKPYLSQYAADNSEDVEELKLLYNKMNEGCPDDELTIKLKAEIFRLEPTTDDFTKAKRIDPASATEANNLIAKYISCLPDVQIIFFSPYELGDKYLVKCWIQEYTNVRVK